MIEINLLAQKKPFRLPVIAGIDFSSLNIKMLIVAVIIYQVPGGFLADEWRKDIPPLKEKMEALRKEVQKLKSYVKKHRNLKDKLEAFHAQVEKLKERSKQVDQLMHKKTNPRKVLERLARNVPDDLWFDKFVITPERQVIINGASTSYKSIGNFLLLANESLFFGKTLSLGNSSTKEKDIAGMKRRVEEFEIKGEITVFDPEL